MPPVQAGPLPHWQPTGPQVSAVVVLHEVQVAPFAPQLLTEAGTQLSNSQQFAPVQVLESQTQLPPEQRWPGPQGPLKPHEQDPLRQRSALRLLQAEQVTPPTPHAVTVGAPTHVWPMQQPAQI